MTGHETQGAPVLRLALVLGAMAAKHYVADFVIQTSWLARGKERATHWVLPLALHASSHAALTLLIALAIDPALWWLAVVDFGVHFTLDRGKAAFAAQHRWVPNQNQFWWLFGFDQLLHHLTDTGLAIVLLAH